MKSDSSGKKYPITMRPASDMTKREVIAMHILAAFSNGQLREADGYSYTEIAEEAVLQADALLVALRRAGHSMLCMDDPGEDDG